MDELAIFTQALDIESPAERAAFVQQACGADAALRGRVEALLHSHQAAGSFLDAPLVHSPPTTDQPVAEKPGTQIGPYKLLQQIGEGGFGIVFMAEQTEPVRRRVALKVIKPGMDTRQVIARFEAERQALAVMDHPNIAKVLDAGATESGRPYFVMELVRGTPITEYCDENSLNIRERLALFASVCQAIQHAHTKGIIHRDVKPTNVLVTRQDGQPVVKVIDFGVAKAMGQQLTEKTLFTDFAQMIGTPLYMSPEQAELSSTDIDTRSDIYSLGVLLYELLTGSTPVSKEQLKQAAFDEIRRIIREDEPQKPSTRISTAEAAPSIAAQRHTEPAKLTRLVRGELDWIVMKALEKDRNRRYETANGLAKDVQRYLSDEQVQACPPSAMYRFRKFARRNKSALAVAALVLFFLTLLGSGVGWAVRDRSAREAEVARERQEREAEIARERRDREAAIDREVSHLLDEAGTLTGEEKWPEALAAVDRADKLLASAGRPARPQRLLDLQKALSMALRLENIYQAPQPATSADLAVTPAGESDSVPGPVNVALEEEFFSGRQQDAQFAAAFQEFGIDVDALAPAEAAAYINRTDIRPAFIKALDDWASLRRRARGVNDPAWKKLVAVARQVDPDPWRNAFREALLARNGKALLDLAETVPVREVPPATLSLLAMALRELNAPERAIDMLRQAQRQHPDDLWINSTLAQLESSSGHYNEALRYYTVAAAVRPRSPRWRKAIGFALFYIGQGEEAVLEFSRAVAMDPKNAEGHASLAFGLQNSDRKNEAIAELREASRLQQNNANYRVRLGNLLRTTGDLDGAIAELRKAVELSPKIGDYHNSLGMALRVKGDRDAANAEYREAETLNPAQAWQYHQARAVLLSGHRRDFDEAIAEYRAALRLKNDDAWLHFHAGEFLRDRGKLDEAIAEYHAAMRLEGGNARHHFGVGQALRWKGDFDGAIAECREAIRLSPANGHFHNLIGIALWAKGDRDAAKAEYGVAEALSPTAAWLFHHERALALNSKRDVDGAIAEYRAAIRLKNDYATSHLYLAQLLTVKGELDEAIAEFRAAIQLDAGEVLNHLGLGQALSQKGDLDGAIVAYREAVRLDPANGHFHNVIGIALWAKGDQVAAQAEYSVAEQLNPKEARSYLAARRAALTAQGNVDGAIAEYRAAMARQVNFDDAGWHFDLAELLMQKGELDEAIAEYRAAIQLDAGEVLNHLGLGYALSKKGDLDGAIAAYGEAVRLSPASGQLHNSLGIALWAKGDQVAAEAEYSVADKLDPKNAWIHHKVRGHTLYLRGDLNDAIAEFREAVRLKNDDMESHRGLAEALRDRGDLDEAIEHYRKAIELLPNYAYIHLALGRVLTKQGKVDEAIACYKKAIELDPKYDGAWIPLGVALRDLRDQKKCDEAIAWWRKVIELSSLVPNEAYIQLGVTLEHRKRPDEAIAVYRQGLERLPDKVTLHLQLAHVLWKQRRLEEAADSYRAAIKLNPQNIYYQHHYLGRILNEQKKHKEAVDALRKAIDINPKYASAHYELGVALEALGQAADSIDKGLLDEAAAEFRAYERLMREAHRLKPDDVGARDALARALNHLAWPLATHAEAARRDPDRAVSLAQEALELAPQNGLFCNTLGTALYRAGRWKEAIETLEKAEQLLAGKYHSYNAFFIAMAHWQLGNKEEARNWYDKAVEWMDNNQPKNEELRRFRVEAAELMKVEEKKE